MGRSNTIQAGSIIAQSVYLVESGPSCKRGSLASELLARLLETHSFSDLDHHLVVGIHLLLDQRNGLFCQLLGQHDHPVQITNEIIAWPDLHILLLRRQFHGHIDTHHLDQLLRRRRAHIPSKDGVAQLAVLVQVAKAPVNDAPHGPARLRPRRHQPAVDGVGRLGRARDEDDGAGGDGVDVVLGELGRRVGEGRVLDRVGGADDARGAGLALGGPEGEAREEAAVAVLELHEGVGDVAGGEVLELGDDGVRGGGVTRARGGHGGAALACDGQRATGERTLGGLVGGEKGAR